jgi:hypothetical protein
MTRVVGWLVALVCVLTACSDVPVDGHGHAGRYVAPTSEVAAAQSGLTAYAKSHPVEDGNPIITLCPLGKVGDLAGAATVDELLGPSWSEIAGISHHIIYKITCAAQTTDNTGQLALVAIDDFSADKLKSGGIYGADTSLQWSASSTVEGGQLYTASAAIDKCTVAWLATGASFGLAVEVKSPGVTQEQCTDVLTRTVPAMLAALAHAS